MAGSIESGNSSAASSSASKVISTESDENKPVVGPGEIERDSTPSLRVIWRELGKPGKEEKEGTSSHSHEAEETDGRESNDREKGLKRQQEKIILETNSMHSPLSPRMPKYKDSVLDSQSWHPRGMELNGEVEGNEVFDVKAQIKRLQAMSPPKPMAKKSTTDSSKPVWLVTGSIPKAKLLSEDSRHMVDPLERRKFQKQEVEEKKLEINVSSLPPPPPPQETSPMSLKPVKRYPTVQTRFPSPTAHRNDRGKAPSPEPAKDVGKGLTPKAQPQHKTISTQTHNAPIPQKSSLASSSAAAPAKSGGRDEQTIEETFEEEFVEEIMEESIDDGETSDEQSFLEDSFSVEQTSAKATIGAFGEEPVAQWKPIDTDFLPMRHPLAQNIANNPNVVKVEEESDAEHFFTRESLSKSATIESDADSWNVPPNRDEDDSSWVNPARETNSTRKKELGARLKVSSSGVEISVASTESHSTFSAQRNAEQTSYISQPQSEHQHFFLSVTPRVGSVEKYQGSSAASFSGGQHIRADKKNKLDHMEQGNLRHPPKYKYEDEYPTRELVGALKHVTPTDSFDEVASKRVFVTTLPNESHYVVNPWSLPSSSTAVDRTFRKLDGTSTDGRDCRFTYITAASSENAVSYNDEIRERYFPDYDSNPFWAQPAEESDGETFDMSVPLENDESWVPTEIPAQKVSPKPISNGRFSNAPVSSTMQLESKWVPGSSKSRTKRVDFTGTVTGEDSDEFDWNPKVGAFPESSTEESSEMVAVDEDEWFSQLNDSQEIFNRVDVSERSKTKNKVEYGENNIVSSTSGRLRFDMTPDMIFIENGVEAALEEERKKAKGSEKKERNNDNGMPKKAYRSRLVYLILCVLLLIIPAGVVVLVFVFLKEDEGGTDLSSNPTISSVPTQAPNFGSRPPFESPTLPPSENQPNAPSPSIPTLIPPSFLPPSGISDDALIELLSLVSADGGAALQDPTSPQHTAMLWLQSTNNSGVNEVSVILQRYALAVLYYSTLGDQWTTAYSWLTSASECSWFAVTCNDKNNVEHLDLAVNNLMGTIPMELDLLRDSLCAYP